MAFAARRLDHSPFVNNCSNLGLLIAKHNDNIDDPEEKEHTAKEEALQKMAKFKLKGESKKIYRSAFNRWKTATENCANCERFEIKSTSRVLLGTGNASVFEYGFNLNYPWGVPFIHGSSLKGLVSSYMARYGGSDWKMERSEESNDARVELFGGERVEDDFVVSYSGLLRFYDAWLLPEQDEWFETDIINSHYPGYYGAGKILPDGTQNPIPVKIVALKPELTFSVCIQGPEEQRQLAKKQLLDALCGEGIGGKTAVGYGRFEYVQSEGEKNSALKKAIEKTQSENEFAALYRENKKNNSLRPVFRSNVSRFGQTPALQQIWEVLRPLRRLHEMVKNNDFKTLKDINNRYKNLKPKIETWKKEENVEELRLNDDARELCNVVIEKWGAEVTNNMELNIVRDIAYGWLDLRPNAETIMKIIADVKHVWPPKNQLKEFVENAEYIEKDDKCFLLELMG